MEIGRFYQRSGTVARGDLSLPQCGRQVSRPSSHTPEALERLVECYLALGLPDEARKTAAVLGKNYPGTYWYRQSLRLLLKEQKQTGMRTAAARQEASESPSAGCLRLSCEHAEAARHP